MKRRTLDIMFSTGGLVLAGLLLIVGVVLVLFVVLAPEGIVGLVRRLRHR